MILLKGESPTATKPDSLSGEGRKRRTSVRRFFLSLVKVNATVAVAFILAKKRIGKLVCIVMSRLWYNYGFLKQSASNAGKEMSWIK